jgi:hypothetical protein
MFNILFVIAIIATIFWLWIWLLLDSSSENYFPDINEYLSTSKNH